MRILFIHNRYRVKGGEDTVFEQEYRLAQQWAVTEKFVTFNKPGLAGAWQFFSSIWNIAAARELQKTIDAFKPDLIHLHNWHYATGPLVIRRIHRMGIPIVHTISNFRLICPSGTLYHKGEVYERSLTEPFPWSAVRDKVYRNSFLQTLWLAFVVYFHKWVGTWKMIDKLIFLSDFSKDRFLASRFSLRADQPTVKPNFIFDNAPVETARKKDQFLFIGRLSEEKGLPVLLKAFRENGYDLCIAGDGPMLPLVREYANTCRNINYSGSLDHSGVHRALRESAILIFPSIWYEGMPMTIIEAFSNGTPVMASALGVMPMMITNGYNGFLFEAGDAESLNKKISYWVALSDAERDLLHHNAREAYERHYTPVVNDSIIRNIYEEALRGRSANTSLFSNYNVPKKTHITKSYAG